MITAEQLRPMRDMVLNDEATVELKERIAQLRRERDPFYLSLDEFDTIVRWKLRRQYGRQEERRQANTDEVIREVTGLALRITHDDSDYEDELRVRILSVLRGVGMGVASAVLALVFPERYAVIDYRCWRRVFDEDRSSFTVGQYRRYLAKIRRLAEELGWTVQEVDQAIWEYDRLHNG